MCLTLAHMLSHMIPSQAHMINHMIPSHAEHPIEKENESRKWKVADDTNTRSKVHKTCDYEILREKNSLEYKNKEMNEKIKEFEKEKNDFDLA